MFSVGLAEKQAVDSRFCAKFYRLDVYGREQETRFGLVFRSAARLDFAYDGFRIAGPRSYNTYKNNKQKRPPK